ncbi:telomerase reverse transcriptase-like isoform X2 [Planococcus citri]|uniref:telomerase reverse transcriptase-like isoform X2 n=1 Tax=Planococcus citri TaxID=170843 RepID=UPI0031F8EEDF
MNNVNAVGYSGNKSYNLYYFTKTRNLRCSWPHNNLLKSAKDENDLLRSILEQNVGPDQRQVFKNENLQDLKHLLKIFLSRHRKIRYGPLLRKCTSAKREDRATSADLRPLSRQVLKEFLHRIIFNVIPTDLFGSKENQLQFERNLRQVLRFGKLQVYTLKMLMNKISTKKVKYLKPFAENFQRTNLMAKVYIWILRIYIFAAIKCIFYVTENNYSNELFFYDKQTWQKIQQKCLNSIKKEVIRKYGNFPVNSRTITSRNIFILRILPKIKGSRPIFVRWKNDEYAKLRAAHEVQVMKQTLSQVASLCFKMSQTTSEEFHNRWLNLYYAWLSLGKPPVYFVRVDFVDAFGSIKQSKLIEIIERLNNQYPLKEIEYSFQYKAKKITKDDAFKILQNYISNFLFKDNKTIYKLTRGIYQGGALSSPLCNIYFSEINANYLVEYLNDPVGFFVQNCDDYLYITMNHTNAIKYLNRMQEGFPEFNMMINTSKTKTNVYDTSEYMTDFGKFQINVNSFQISSCFKSYQGIKTFHRSTFRSLASPGEILMRRLLLFCTMKVDKIYFDCTYNSIDTVAYNVFLLAYLAAIRCVSMMKAIFTNYNRKYIFDCVEKCTFRLSKAVSKKVNQHKDIFKESVLQWITLQAFCVKFKKSGRVLNCLGDKIQRYASILCDNFSDRQKNLIVDKFFCEPPPNVMRNIL